VVATLPAFQVVFSSSASSAAFSLAQLPLALECLDPALKLLPLHLQALWQSVLLHAACLWSVSRIFSSSLSSAPLPKELLPDDVLQVVVDTPYCLLGEML
jgi:hypothetical protein